MSHGNRAHSAFKSIPKMEQDRKVKVDYNGGIYSVHFGINSIRRKTLKKIHSKKRRQYFKKMDTMPT